LRASVTHGRPADRPRPVAISPAAGRWWPACDGRS
jgi:hypothetical protein